MFSANLPAAGPIGPDSFPDALPTPLPTNFPASGLIKVES